MSNNLEHEKKSREITECVSSIVVSYNRVAQGAMTREEFFSMYTSVRVLDIANTIERLENPEAKPVLTDNSDGIYMGLPVIHTQFLAVVPKFFLILTPMNYNTAAIKEFFQCKNYQPEKRFKRITLIKPVFLDAAPGSNKWKLMGVRGKEQLGTLELELPEPL